MMSRVRRHGSACMAVALTLTVTLSTVAPAQARPPALPQPAVQPAEAPSFNSAAPDPTWLAMEQTASAAQSSEGFWAPIYALVMAWRSAIGTLITHMWKSGSSGSETCR